MSLLPYLKAANLLPSPIIPSSFTPSIDLKISFSNLTPADGSFARVSQVSSQPIITASYTDSTPTGSAKYTFMLIDPDAPSPADPKFGFWRHWIVTSIPSNAISASTSTIDSSSSITESGVTLTPYLAPGPKDESGPHRYLFLLFAEPAGLKLSNGDVGGEEFVERRSFRAEEWVEKYGLELVGVQWMSGVGDGWVAEGTGAEDKNEL